MVRAPCIGSVCGPASKGNKSRPPATVQGAGDAGAFSGGAWPHAAPAESAGGHSPESPSIVQVRLRPFRAVPRSAVQSALRPASSAATRKEVGQEERARRAKARQRLGETCFFEAAARVRGASIFRETETSEPQGWRASDRHLPSARARGNDQGRSRARSRMFPKRNPSRARKNMLLGRRSRP